ncbi:MAG: hypothetical protein HW403_1401 [Dehalococcoidia bacterium]|nr:hypothetical protein [Dehalococcoidia bacterium]
MADKEKFKAWMSQRSAEDDRLYEQYGHLLEQEHRGEFAAISPQGEVITGVDELTVATKALERFGAGNFALRRIGAEAEIRWRYL